MKSDLKIKNIVLVGSFNPSAFDKLFFVKNNIFKEEEILPNSIFSFDGVQLITNDFNIVIVLNQLIISSQHPDKKDDKINDVLLKIVLVSSIKNITASGINFHWTIVCEEKESIEEITKSNFYNENNKLLSTFFNTQDSKYGIYASKNINLARMRFDVKPIKALENSTHKHALNFSFNFHYDVKDKEKLTDLVDFFKKYDEYRDECEKIISSFK